VSQNEVHKTKFSIEPNTVFYWRCRINRLKHNFF
jgi:hypothetical protein